MGFSTTLCEPGEPAGGTVSVALSTTLGQMVGSGGSMLTIATSMHGDEGSAPGAGCVSEQSTDEIWVSLHLWFAAGSLALVAGSGTACMALARWLSVLHSRNGAAPLGEGFVALAAQGGCAASILGDVQEPPG